MTPLQIIFIATAITMVVASLLVVTRRNMVHAALYLVLALFGVAVLLVLLEAFFLAVVQVIIYIGAIAILMIFAVMLTRRITDDELPAFNQSGRAAAMIALLVFSGLALIMGSWSDFTSAQADEITRAGLVGEEVGQRLIQELGQSLVSPEAYVIPFEVASVLLLAALIGSIVIARQSDKEAGR